MMRTGWVFLLLLFAPALYAVDIEVARSFTISGLTRTEGKLVFPAERQKYYNIRVLDKATYDFVSSCQTSCLQKLSAVTPVVAEVRPAQTRPHMWVAQVSFNRAWLVTFLVFKKGNDFEVKPPEHFTFISDKLATQTRQVILQAIRQQENV